MQFPGESYCWSIALHKADSLLLVLYFVTDRTEVKDSMNEYLHLLPLDRTG
jgi:hypothetical protein